MRAVIIVWIGLLAAPLPGASKREWHDGKVVKVETENLVEGTNVQRFYYTIDTGAALLIVTDKAVWRWSKPTQVAEDDPVKWAIDKKKVYMIGPDGLEHTLELRRRETKPKKPAQ